MPCDTQTKRGQTLQQRAEEVRKTVTQLEALIAERRVQVRVGPQGAVAFAGWTAEQKDGVTDACAYRRIMATGSQMAKLAIMQAEQMAGVSVNKQVIAHGVHSHDGGRTWHGKG